MRKQAKAVPAEAFVKACLKGGTAKQIAGRLGCSRAVVYMRYASFKKKGIKLPPITRDQMGHRLDVKALNALISPPKPRAPRKKAEAAPPAEKV